MSSRCPSDALGQPARLMPLRAIVLSTCTVMLSLPLVASAQTAPANAAKADETNCCGTTAQKSFVRIGPGEAERPVLRIAADPNNLPFTNSRYEGFENKIAEVIARELGMDIEYTWRAQRRGFFRQALKEKECDLVLGVPAGFEMALTTKPYYRSTYVFISRKDRDLQITSLDDPRLRDLQIGLTLLGDDGANTPPAHALAARGIVHNVVGYSVYGDYTQENPPARVIDGVTEGEVDLAIVWGPLAGFFARQQPSIEFDIVPVKPERDRTGQPFAFSISMGVPKDQREFRNGLNAVLERKRSEINRILEAYGVPRVPLLDEAASRRGEDDD